MLNHVPALLQLSVELDPMPGRQRLVAIGLAAAVLVVVVELLRRRKLREEYSWLWVGTAVLLLGLAIWQESVITLSEWLGAASTTSALFFGCLLFLLAICLQYSVRLSRLTARQKALSQRVALLEAELRLRQQAPGGDDEAGDTVTPLRKPASRPEPANAARDGVA